MFAKVPGGPRSQATNPTEPMSKATIRVPGFCSMVVIVLEEISNSPCLLRRSNILVLEDTAPSSFLYMPNHNWLDPYFLFSSQVDLLSHVLVFVPLQQWFGEMLKCITIFQPLKFYDKSFWKSLPVQPKAQIANPPDAESR